MYIVLEYNYKTRLRQKKISRFKPAYYIPWLEIIAA